MTTLYVDGLGLIFVSTVQICVPTAPLRCDVNFWFTIGFVSPVVQVPFGASKGVVAHAIRMPHDTEIRSFGNGEKKTFLGPPGGPKNGTAGCTFFRFFIIRWRRSQKRDRLAVQFLGPHSMHFDGFELCFLSSLLHCNLGHCDVWLSLYCSQQIRNDLHTKSWSKKKMACIHWHKLTKCTKLALLVFTVLGARTFLWLKFLVSIKWRCSLKTRLLKLRCSVTPRSSNAWIRMRLFCILSTCVDGAMSRFIQRFSTALNRHTWHALNTFNTIHKSSINDHVN